MISPLITSAANALLEQKVNQLYQFDPFWREQLAQMNGLRLKLILTDIGFKRVIQLGPTQIHLCAPYTEADATLTTQTIHLSKLLHAEQTKQALADGHFYLTGKPAAFERFVQCLRCYDGDWESKLAQWLPGSLVYQAHGVGKLLKRSFDAGLNNMQQSYRFWRDNEKQGKTV
jgi:ubiquinone biosynthesis protein UbiJ